LHSLHYNYKNSDGSFSAGQVIGSKYTVILLVYASEPSLLIYSTGDLLHDVRLNLQNFVALCDSLCQY